MLHDCGLVAVNLHRKLKEDHKTNVNAAAAAAAAAKTSLTPLRSVKTRLGNLKHVLVRLRIVKTRF